MRAGEEMSHAARRCLVARLRLAGSIAQETVDGSKLLRTTTEAVASPSFPRLRCAFEVTHIEARLLAGALPPPRGARQGWGEKPKVSSS